MKTGCACKRVGFTLVELLVVIAIIGALTALLFPVAASVKSKVKGANARTEMGDIVNAIHAYESAYSRLPLSDAAARSVSETAFPPAGADFNFGAVLQKKNGSTVILGAPGNYKTNNSELMAILVDLETFGNGQPTINKGHAVNPHRTTFLHPKTTASTNSPGVGPDGIYRDPWGSPYIISLDCNNDTSTRDPFYSAPAISASTNDPNHGLTGLVKKTLPNGGIVFEAATSVMVWSLGPDGQVNFDLKANEGENKDNVLSWK